MSFMEMQIFRKGATYCADCSKCGATNYIHEWTTDAFNEGRDAMEAGTYPCDHCHGKTDASTFMKLRDQYAGWYSAPGYMDRTDMHYSPNKRTLERELKDLYGDDTCP